MFLHAYRLKITHPATGEALQLDAPLPPECRRFIDQLKQLSGDTQ
jgi:23S rRNA pseudouridine955/2504/2580 synthase